jgi:hypothetical protein
MSGLRKKSSIGINGAGEDPAARASRANGADKSSERLRKNNTAYCMVSLPVIINSG